MICTFFGHRDTPESVEPLIEETVIKLIGEGVNEFLVGNNGRFDGYVRSILKRLAEKYKIKYSVVLAYMPVAKRDGEDFFDTVYPEVLAGVPRKFAILKRNRYMIDMSDVIVVYVRHSDGGAYTALEYAEKKKKRIVNLVS